MYGALTIAILFATLKFITPEISPSKYTPLKRYSFINDKREKSKELIVKGTASNDSKEKNIEENFYHTPLPEIDAPFHSRRRSEKLLKLFKKKTYLKIPDMDDYLFEDYSQDDVAILVGKNYKSERLTILATRQSVDPKDFNALLKDDPSLLPLADPAIREGSFSLAEEHNFEINGFSGVSAFTKEQGGKFFTIFYAPRADGQGTYGMVLEGNKKEIMDNYDYYEEKFMGFKALSE